MEKITTSTELLELLEFKLTSMIDTAKEFTTVENFLDRDVNYRVTNVYSFIRSFAELISFAKYRIESFGENSINEDDIERIKQRSEHLINSIATEVAFLQIKKDREELNLN